MGIIDSDSATGPLTNNGTHELEVSASNADKLYVMVDDGTSGNKPASHDVTLEAYSPPPEEDRYKFILEKTGKTFRSYRFESAGSKDRVTITNTSGSSATFDVTVISRD